MELAEIIKSLSFHSIIKSITKLFPELEKELWIAQINEKPEYHVRSKLKTSLLISLVMAVLTFMLIKKNGGSYFSVVIAFVVFFAIIFFTQMQTAHSKMMKRRKEIDKEVLFAGRFLLVKLNSGKPLINALMDASKSYGVANDYFKSIIHEIETGTTIENALRKAIKYSPSEKMKKILLQITNALKIGIDVTRSLEATLDQIADEQLIEIQRYGKKLSSITMFYMLGAIVLPSLGLTMFVIIASIINFTAGPSLFVVLGIFLIIMELFFISIFKSARPSINL